MLLSGLNTLLLVLFHAVKCNGEMFTAIADMEYLVYTEKDLISSLQRYLQTEQKRLHSLKNFLGKVEASLEQVNKTSVGQFVGNPINSYLMLKRFSKEWAKMENLITQNLAVDVVHNIEIAKPYFPTNEDYYGAMTAIFRLQDTYQLPAKHLVNGLVAGVTNAIDLSVEDVYDLGKHAYNLKDYFHTKGWMDVALSKLGSEVFKDGIHRFDVIDHLAFSEYQRGNVKRALILTEELIKLKPENVRMRGNLEFFKSEVTKMYSTGARGDTGLTDNSLKKGTGTPSTIKKDEWEERRSYMDYEKLCRGETKKQTKAERRKMLCRYKIGKSGNRYNPWRVERIWVKPNIVIFKNILSDSDMKNVRNMALPKLRRATIQDPQTGELKHAPYRISKSAWLKDGEDPLIRKISSKIEDATGLTMDTAEELQIANYGIGGHYEPHFDFAREDEDKFTDLGTGNRIATMLFYMSDVQAGGATVFTAAEAAVFPSKGDGVFWYNLKRSGEGDHSTKHAACPVLSGTKWVANKWIHEYGQEFRRKCGLKKNSL